LNKREGNQSILKSLIATLADPSDSKHSQFLPTTPHVHKFRTEMCKNYELTGKCKFGDEVSKFYFKRVLIIITPYIVFFRPLEKLNDDEKLSERQLQN